MIDIIRKKAYSTLACSIFGVTLDDLKNPSRYADTVMFMESDWADTLFGLAGKTFEKQFKQKWEKLFKTIVPRSDQEWILWAYDNPEQFCRGVSEMQKVLRAKGRKASVAHKMYQAWCEENGKSPVSYKVFWEGIAGKNPVKEITSPENAH